MHLENLSENALVRIYQEYNTSCQQVEEDVQMLKAWLQLQPHLPQVVDYAFLKNMLLRTKCSVERTKHSLELHFTLKASLTEFFSRRDPFLPEIQSTLKSMHLVPLPAINSDGYRVILIKNVNSYTTSSEVELVIKYFFMVTDIRLREDVSVGDIYVYDFANVTLGYFTSIPLPMIKKMEICLSKAYRARIKGLHFINAPAAMDIILSMIKSTIRSKVISRMHVHPDLESLYKHVDRDILPEEYGGKAKTLADLGNEWKLKVESYRDWFMEEEKIGIADESKRQGKASWNESDLFGFEGTFKKLTVD